MEKVVSALSLLPWGWGGGVPLTQCREPMHSLAASSGMVASSGFRRMHSFSTFTARADLWEEMASVKLKILDGTKY